MSRMCTCLGTCRGLDGLGEGWVCAMAAGAVPVSRGDPATTEGTKVVYDGPIQSKPRRPRPACSVLFDERWRGQIRTIYGTFGHPGFIMTEALAYIELLEEELAAREKAEAPR